MLVFALGCFSSVVAVAFVWLGVLRALVLCSGFFVSGTSRSRAIVFAACVCRCAVLEVVRLVARLAPVCHLVQQLFALVAIMLRELGELLLKFGTDAIGSRALVLFPP